MAGGGPISRRPLAYSGDGKLLLTPSSTVVNIYSAVTGEYIACLAGHKDDVTCVLLDPQDSNQVYTASLDGHLKKWAYREQTCVESFNIKEAVRSMVIHKDLKVAYLSIEGFQTGRVIAYRLAEHKTGGTAMKVPVPGPLALSPAGGFVATFSKHSLYVWRTGNDIYQPINLHHTKPYTCVAISSNDTILAAGDASGRILIWRHFDAYVPSVKRDNEHKGNYHPDILPPVTTIHWHANPVGCLSFSPDGVHLLSGGQEGVLVLWHLESNRPTFLPRLGGGLVGLHPHPEDPAQYCIRQSDNTLRTVNTATMKVESSVHGLKPSPASASFHDITTATTLQPGTGNLVVPSSHSQLQWYDTVRDRHVMLGQVQPRNMVSLTERKEGDIQENVSQPYVQHVAFSSDGTSLATVDVRPDAGVFGSTESTLRFWDVASTSSQSSSATGPLTLNTRVDDPHSGSVSSVSYHPTSDMVVSCGSEDREFRVWMRTKAPKRPGSATHQSSCWRCRSSGNYRGLQLTASAFSPDGSTLAIAAESYVTLWDPAANTVACVLASPSFPSTEPLLTLPAPNAQGNPHPSLSAASAQHINRLAFIPGTPFLVGTTPTGVTVWNLLTAAVHWSHRFPVCSLTVDPFSRCFAVGVPSAQSLLVLSGAMKWQMKNLDRFKAAAEKAPPPCAHVIVFEPSSSAPKLYCKVPQTHRVVALYAPLQATHTAGSSSSASPLLLIKDNRQFAVAVLEDATSEPPAPTSILIPESDNVGALQAAFGSVTKPTVDASEDGPVAMDVETMGSEPVWKALFDAPSHALPPPTVLAQAFLQLLTTSEVG